MSRPEAPPPADPDEFALATLHEAVRRLRSAPRKRFARSEDVRIVLEALIELYDERRELTSIRCTAERSRDDVRGLAEAREAWRRERREARGLPPTPQPPPTPETPAEASALIRKLWGKPECSVILTMERST